MWHEAFSNKNSILNYQLTKSINNKKFTQTNLLKRFDVNKTNFYKKPFILPSKWNLLILYNSNIRNYSFIFYCQSFFFKIPLHSNNNLFSYDSVTKQVTIDANFVTNYTLTLLRLLQSFLQSTLVPNFRKLKFKGKGYYIYKNHRNTITPQFGYSHRLYLYSFFSQVKFLSKSDLLVFGVSIKNVNYLHIYI